MLFTSLMMILIQGAVIYAIIVEIFQNKDVFVVNQNDEFQLIIAKFLTTYAIHFNLLPFMKQSLDIFKFIVNHEEEFD